MCTTIAVVGARPRDHAHISNKLPKAVKIIFCEAKEVRKINSILSSNVSMVYHNYRFGSHTAGFVLNNEKPVKNFSGGISALVRLILEDLRLGVLS